jgi:hypothetical protein
VLVRLGEEVQEVSRGLDVAEEREVSLQEQLEEIGAQLDWVRGYL